MSYCLKKTLKTLRITNKKKLSYYLIFLLMDLFAKAALNSLSPFWYPLHGFQYEGSYFGSSVIRSFPRFIGNKVLFWVLSARERILFRVLGDSVYLIFLDPRILSRTLIHLFIHHVDMYCLHWVNHPKI